MNQKGVTMASERYPVHGWLLLGNWLHYQQERRSFKNESAITIQTAFNDYLKIFHAVSDIPPISTAQIRYACRVLQIDYKRKYPL